MSLGATSVNALKEAKEIPTLLDVLDHVQMSAKKMMIVQDSLPAFQINAEILVHLFLVEKMPIVCRRTMLLGAVARVDSAKTKTVIVCHNAKTSIVVKMPNVLYL